MLGWLALAAALAGNGDKPRPAPAHFGSGVYAITFRVPKGASYCPLGKDWSGSDHGTTVFLEPPRHCLGTGFPSSARGFVPDKVARIELYYQYWMGEDSAAPEPCRRVGTMLFLGKRRAVCEVRKGGIIARTVTARYAAGGGSEAYLTLVTRADRLARDMAVFRTAAASVRECKSVWEGGDTVGRGAPCPKDSWF